MLFLSHDLKSNDLGTYGYDFSLSVVSRIALIVHKFELSPVFSVNDNNASVMGHILGLLLVLFHKNGLFFLVSIDGYLGAHQF